MKKGGFVLCFALVVVLASGVFALPITSISKINNTITPTVVRPANVKVYDFVSENDIEAYRCRMGPYPSEFPDSFDSEICNREFIDITDRNGLDFPDEDAVGGSGWSGYAMHQFFVLKDVQKNKLTSFAVGYVAYNDYSGNIENYQIYLKNFDLNSWELLDEADLGMNEQGFMGYIGSYGNQKRYVNDESEMWFMATGGPYSFNSVSTDAFAAVLVSNRLQGVRNIDPEFYPGWLGYVFD